MSHKQPSLSIEFFPPRTEEGKSNLLKAQQALDAWQPEYYSVTYGAGGTTQEATLDVIEQLQKQGVAAAPHLTCVASVKTDIEALLKQYQALGVKRIVALRGDMPSGMRDLGELHYANELVRFIRETTGDHFHIEVAAYPEMHPQAKCLTSDLDAFANKVNAGANGAVTQYFYNADAYFHFMDLIAKRGVDVPVVPGIMPISNFEQLARFSDMCGAEIPRYIRKTLECYGDDLASIQAYGLEIVVRLCERLLEGGAPGLHFYSMNKPNATDDILTQLPTFFQKSPLK